MNNSLVLYLEGRFILGDQIYDIDFSILVHI